ncbi:MAG: carbohydrate porin [Prolixibacteraceae bacterium]|nr:carbohydrate porin [Prolixibacteraceae bacterium]
MRFNGSATTILQGSRFNNAMEAYATGSFDIFALTSFGKGSLLFFDLEAIGGNGPGQDYPTLSGLNGDAGSTQAVDGIDRLNLLEAWAEFSMFKNTITITAGKIDLTNYFDINASANDETMQFITGSFINSSAFAVPSNSPGMRLKTSLFKRLHFQAALVSTDNSGQKLFDDIYKIASFGYTIAPGSRFESNIRLYGYQHPLAGNDYGWGISFDEVLFGHFNIFGRYGQNFSEVADFWGIKSAWSAGTRFVVTIAQQILAIGVAYGENIPASTELNTEKVAEIYIRRQLNKWIHLSPHFQYIWNTNGTDNEIAVVGLRTQFNF